MEKQPLTDTETPKTLPEAGGVATVSRDVPWEPNNGLKTRKAQEFVYGSDDVLQHRCNRQQSNLICRG